MVGIIGSSVLCFLTALCLFTVVIDERKPGAVIALLIVIAAAITFPILALVGV